MIMSIMKANRIFFLPQLKAKRRTMLLFFIGHYNTAGSRHMRTIFNGLLGTVSHSGLSVQ